MSSLAVFLLLAAVAEDGRPYKERPPIVVVFDGGSGRTRQSAVRVVEGLTASIPSAELVPFDAEPAPAQVFALRGGRGDLLAVRPRTPMRDAMEAAFAHMSNAPGPRTMIVIAHEQFYPSAVSSGRLLDLARQTGATVHTIYLSRKPDQAGFGGRLIRTVRNRFVWFVERAIVEERGYSPRETARLLSRIAAATGGTACAVDDNDQSPDCVARVTAGILAR